MTWNSTDRYSVEMRHGEEQKHSRPWTEQEDDLMFDLVADGMSFSRIGKILGRTKNSCVGRMNRIANKLEIDRARNDD